MGKRYDYITDEDYKAAEENGISATLLEQRAWGLMWDIDRAVETPKKERVCRSKMWNEWKEVAERNGVSRDMFVGRVTKSGWPKELAAIAPKGTRFTSKWTSVEMDEARRNGIDGNGMSLPNARLKLGWSKQDAVSTPKMTTEERLDRVRAGVRNRATNREFNEIF